jgi:hypothetical protein
VTKNAYYTVLDNWYLTKHINIESRNIDKIILNIKNLYREVKNWKDENLQVTIREETVQIPYGLVIFTYDKEVADRVFKNGYNTTARKNLLKDTSGGLVNDQALVADRVSLPSDAPEEVKDSLGDAFIAVERAEVSKESLPVEVTEHLPDELFDDLEEIGLSTFDRTAKPEDEEDTLPDDLFHDLAERAKSMVDHETKPGDKKDN